MITEYYILTAPQYHTHKNNIIFPPSWNVNKSECIVEVNQEYTISEYLNKFTTNNGVQDYIYNPIRINEWYQPDISELP